MTFVDYEQAKWLKRIGFNEQCKYYYDFIGDICSETKGTNWNISNESLYSRPEQHQVVNWLLETHNILIFPDVQFKKGVGSYWWNIKGDGINRFSKLINRFNSLPEVYSAAFNYMLDNNLI